MFHLYSGLHTAILFSLCSANLSLKIDHTKANEKNMKTIKNTSVARNWTYADKAARFQKYPKTFIHRHLDNKDVKNNLDTFSMARRYAIPFLNYKSVPFPSVLNRRTNSFETNERSKRNELVREFQDDEIFDVLYQQTILMEKLAQVMEMEHSALRSKNDFQDLLTGMDSSIRNRTTTTTVATTAVKLKKKLSTIMTVVDETEVRKALKEDPLVRRIIRMANRKKVEYIEAAKKFFN